VTLRVSSSLDKPTSGDHEATWLLGHTERISFGRLWRHHDDLFCRATLHVPCKHLKRNGDEVQCAAWGFSGTLPRSQTANQGRHLGGDRFRIVERGKLVQRLLPRPAIAPRRLVVLSQNPCATAPCQTSDHKVGAACCRDLQIEIMCDKSWTRQELLIRSRQSPYLCKVTRERDDAIEAEMISACGYLGEDGVACELHGRKRPTGESAKPNLCHRWPHPTGEEVLHPGCVFEKRASGYGLRAAGNESQAEARSPGVLTP
jgi:hypothetical protein